MTALSKKRRLLVSRDVQNGMGSCHYCGRMFLTQNLTIDHYIPRSRGGSVMSIKNMVLCCYKCNKHKGSMFPHEFYQTRNDKTEHTNMMFKIIYSGFPKHCLCGTCSAVND